MVLRLLDNENERGLKFTALYLKTIFFNHFKNGQFEILKSRDVEF